MFRCIIAFVCLSTSIFAQTTTATQTDVFATNKLAASYAAFAGIQTPANVTISGTLVQHLGTDSSGTFTFEATAAGRSKLTLNLPEGTRVEIASGYSEIADCSWSLNGQSHKAATHNCHSPAVWMLPLLAMNSAQTKLRVAASGDDLKLDVPSSDSDEQRSSESLLSVDSVTALPTKLTFNTHSDKSALDNIPVEVTYSDYRDISGIKVPFSVKKSVNGTVIFEFTVTSAQFNTGTEAR